MNEQLYNLCERVSQLPIEEVIGGEISVSGHGVYLDALCPFHHDHKLGNFKINTARGIWKCYSCGTGGRGGVAFYKKLYHVSTMQAIAEIGLKHRVLSKSEASLLSTTCLTQEPRKMIQIIAGKPEKENEKLPADELDKVYQAFIESCSDFSPDFRQKLLKERCLKESDLSNFFQMPQECSSEFMARFYQRLRERKINRQALEHTPGFYYDTRNNLYRFSGAHAVNALGIISHDFDGKINGIQIRKETEDKGKRYIWFSTGWANGKDGCEKGTTNSGVIDFLPSSKHPGSILCTEGKFKALKLQKLGYSTLNMHGVSSWPANKVIQYAKNHSIQKIGLCYDADIETNAAVAKAALYFSSALLAAGFQVSYLRWDIQYGKGVDDMINAGFLKKIQCLEGQQFNEQVLVPFLQKNGLEFH